MYKLGNRTAARMMEGVHPLLISCVCLAMRKHAMIDFGVGANAVRTIEQQRGYVSKGLSKTMNSKHLPQKDGYSHAVDLYPVGYNPKNKKKSKEQLELIAIAMNDAAFELGIELDGGFKWGWDLGHFEIEKIFDSLVELVKAHRASRSSKNRMG